MFYRAFQISNSTIAERILNGTLTASSLHTVQNKKEINLLTGKHSEVSLEKHVLRLIREKKRLLLSNRPDKFEMQQRNMFTRLKKEPEKNKTLWDCMLQDMKWMHNDFGKERRNKRKLGYTFVKNIKKI